MTEQRLPFIPNEITVHLGSPDSNAPNVTVPFADYIKNVASSELYPTWPENALRANIIAQVTFALNRIFTEYYRSRGYDFDITNSTTIDQAFVENRDVFENISNLVDELFNVYIKRQGSVEPIYSLYCDGIRVQCEGMSQWGSVDLAEQGYTPYEILQYYYGDDINLNYNTPAQDIQDSYPGRILRVCSIGNDVNFIETWLNRISKNYPAIPKITELGGVYTEQTAEAVRTFQRIFSLPQTGEVDEATWYSIQRIYAAVKRLSDLNSEGLSPAEVTGLFPTQVGLGSTGEAVRLVQYYLNFVAYYNNRVPSVYFNGIFDERTEASVRAFQTEYGLPVTGIVDLGTLDVLYSMYRTFRDSIPEGYFETAPALYPGFPVGVGETGDEVRYLQGYLNLISNTYTQIPKVNVDSIFGPATEAAVLAYQNIFGLEPTGIADIETYTSIVQTYLALREGAQASPGQYTGDISAEGGS